MNSQDYVPSFKKRYLLKLLLNAISGIFSFLSLPLITRALGPANYGIFYLLKINFDKIINFLDVGTSGFYPILSMRPNDKGILRFVILYEVFLILITSILLFVLYISGFIQNIFTADSMWIVTLSFILSWCIVINIKTTYVMDAWGRTITNEKLQLVGRIVLTLCIVLLFLSKKLNLHSYLLIQIGILFISFVFLMFLIKKYSFHEKDSTSVKNIAIEFKNYSFPLFLASIIGIVAGLGDRWILQIFNGSKEQGYYSFGLNLGAICFLITGALTPLLAREYAIAFSNKDREELRNLFSKFIPLFYFITAIISCFLTTHGNSMARLFGGMDFQKAAVPVMLLSLAPIHQTLGQLSGGLMTSTNQTKLYGIITAFTTIIGLPLTYLLIAPTEYFGLHLGAIGLSLKLVTLQILSVNIQLWFNTRYLGLGMWQFILRQIVVVALLLITGIFSKWLVSLFFETSLTGVLVSCSLYIMFILLFVMIFPWLIGMTRLQIVSLFKSQLNFFQKQQ